MDFTVPVDRRVKIEESKNCDKYLNLAKELKKNLWNVGANVIPIVIVGLGTVPKGLLGGMD